MIDGGAGDDLIDGGGGSNTLDLTISDLSDLTIDLAITTAQDTGQAFSRYSILLTSSAASRPPTLCGNAAANILTGYERV